jgi:accessory gene regulator protein AgrB
MLALRRKFSDPVFLVALVAALGAFVVQSGELGSSDTTHRLQLAHSFWTSEPPVFPQEYPEFGLHGRGGKLQSWYGMGQSLLMLPADIIGTYIERLPIFARYNGNDPAVRSIVVSYWTNILVNVLTALIAFRFLRQLGFSTKHAIAGVLALLFCTTHLHYTQNMMENNYIMLLTLLGFSFQFEWLQTGNTRALLIGSAALGLNLLTRLTTGLDLLAAGVFLLLVLLFEHEAAVVWGRLRTYIKIAAPVYAMFGLIDRLYQYYRFGSFTNTYVTIFAQEYHRLDPTLPPNYPWETPFHVGFLGPLIAPEKSIFLFDPLLVLTILISILAWKRFSPQVRAYVLTAFLLLLAYISFYAKYTVWSGDFAWGDRYVSTAAELAAFISVPLLLRHGLQLGRLVWFAGIGLIIISTCIQIASLAFWLPLEIYQMETLGHPTFVIALRFKNIVAFALGKMNEWGLTNHAMMEDDWDYVHITTWNFLPFLLRRVHEAPAWVVRITFLVWGVGIAAFAAMSWQLARVASMNTERQHSQ